MELRKFNVTWQEKNKKYNAVTRTNTVEALTKKYAELLIHNTFGSFHLDKTKDQRIPQYIPSNKINILKVKKVKAEK